MKVVITGINGFVGGSLANYLLNKGHEVSGIGRQIKIADFVDKRCNYIFADISKKIKTFEADVVIHSAALASDNANYDDLYLNNVIGTQNVLDASLHVSNFIQISTSSVYSFNNEPAIEEDGGNKLELLSGYGKTKYLAEQKVLNNKQIPYRTILRPRAIYGVNDRLILPRLLKFVKGNSLILPQHITEKISLTHIDNFIDAIELCIEHPQKCNIYNVTDDEVYSLAQVMPELIIAVTEKDLKLKKIPFFIWEGLLYANQLFMFNKELNRFASNQITKDALLNIDAIKKQLNYRPQRKIYDSYVEIADWIKENGGWEKYLSEYNKYAKQRK